MLEDYDFYTLAHSGKMRGERAGKAAKSDRLSSAASNRLLISTDRSEDTSAYRAGLLGVIRSGSNRGGGFVLAGGGFDPGGAMTDDETPRPALISGQVGFLLLLPGQVR